MLNYLKNVFVCECALYWALSSFAVTADSSLVCPTWLQAITHTFCSWTPVHFLPRGAWKHKHKHSYIKCLNNYTKLNLTGTYHLVLQTAPPHTQSHLSHQSLWGDLWEELEQAASVNTSQLMQVQSLLLKAELTPGHAEAGWMLFALNTGLVGAARSVWGRSKLWHRTRVTLSFRIICSNLKNTSFIQSQQHFNQHHNSVCIM